MRENLHAGLFGILSAGSRLSAESHTYIHKAIQYLEQHYQEPITIPQIADSVGLSSVYLTKLFKLATGKTLSEYLNYYRTQCSLQLLTNSDDTINEISSKVGYSDVRSYIRFFKKFYEITRENIDGNTRKKPDYFSGMALGANALSRPSLATQHVQ